MTLRERIQEMVKHLEKRKDEAEGRCEISFSEWHHGRVVAIGSIIDELNEVLKEDENDVLVQHKQPDATL